MPAGGSSSYSYLPTTMGRRRFSYHRLKKLPHAASPPSGTATATATSPTTTTGGLHGRDEAAARQAQGLPQQHHPPQERPCAESAAVAIEESYRSYYRALVVAKGRMRRQRLGGGSGGGMRPRRRLRVWGALARALRLRAAAAGARVRASVARVARRLREGRPYVGDLFAGNYMFLQMAPSPTTMAAGNTRAMVPFAEYYYDCKARSRAAAAAARTVQLQATTNRVQ